MKSEVADFYYGKRVLVVGGAGMVGSKLVERLLELTTSVFVLDNFSRGRTIIPEAMYMVSSRSLANYWLFGHELLRDGFPHSFPITIDASESGFYWHDIKNIDIVFNLAAAVAGVLHNEKSHLQMYQDNVSLLAGPLRASERAGVQHYLQTSSVCVYAEEHQSPCVEPNGFLGTPHPANAGYAEAKRDGERMVHWSNIPRAVIVRPSNIAGERDYFDSLAHVIPAFIARAAQLRPDRVFQAYGNPEAMREFIYSGDVAEGMLYAMALGEDREAYNVGASGGPEHRRNTLTMELLARKILDEVSRFQPVSDGEIRFDNSRGGGDSIRYSDSTKLRRLGWDERTGLDTIVHLEVKYYLEEVLGQT
jgi:nucleoside-diphosphate-sugar epimerase